MRLIELVKPNPLLTQVVLYTLLKINSRVVRVKIDELSVNRELYDRETKSTRYALRNLDGLYTTEYDDSSVLEWSSRSEYCVEVTVMLKGAITNEIN